MFVMTLVSTWYGGILGVGEFTYEYGLSNWFVMGFPYYIFALIYALFIAGRIRKTNAVSIPELIAGSYGQTSSFIGGFFVFLMTSPAPYLLIAGIMLSLLTGIPSRLSALIIFIISAVYLYKKGFRSVVQSDILQFLLMFAGFAVLAAFLLKQYPISEFISVNHLPAEHLTLTGGLPASYIISWFFIALWTLVDPGFHQRCAAAKSAKTARNGILVSILFWMIFDALTVITGLYARSLLPDIQALYAYPFIAAHILPVGLFGLFFTGLLATVMSTLDSYIFISAQTFGYDILSKYYPGNVKRNVRLGYLVTGLVAMIVLILVPSVISIWYMIGTLVIPSLLIPTLSALFDRTIEKRLIIILMLGSFAFTLTWFAIGKVLGAYPLGLEPFFPGLVFSIVIYSSGRIMSKNRDK
jgi:SSS family solute:Na+ symporter